MDGISRGLRRTAFDRIALLSAKPGASPNSETNELERLGAECPAHPNQSNGIINGIMKSLMPASQVEMTIRELEVLLALCRAAPSIKSLENADKLLQQLAPYLAESHSQLFQYSPYLSEIDPSPWECLTSSLATAIFSLGLKFPSLHNDALEAFKSYLDSVKDALQDDEITRYTSSIAMIVVSLLGFLEAAAVNAEFWTHQQRLLMLSSVQSILQEKFLVDVETTFSTIRNSHERPLRQWKQYNRRYNNIGRPLGAMLLSQGFMKLLVPSTALLLVSPVTLRRRHILDELMEAEPNVNVTTITGANGEAETDDGFKELVAGYADFAVEGIKLVESDSDYLKISTSWQQGLAFSVKSYALVSYCCCALLEDSDTDVNVLVKWLESTMADPIQMADESLAAVTLKIMGILSKNDSYFAASLSRSLPRFIVRGSPSALTVRVAAHCLAYVLQFLSQDAIITTLYTLSNVLSLSNPERAVATNYREKYLNFDQNMGSAISLALTSEDDKNHVFESVIEAIVGVAKSCRDEKIIALAQSILLQKINKVNPSVDRKVLTEVASLALVTGPTDFRTLLKSIAKHAEDAEAANNEPFMRAILDARIYLSRNLASAEDTALYEIYLINLLECVVAKGDVRENEAKRPSDVELAARGIKELLAPLAVLLQEAEKHGKTELAPEVATLFRDAWYNCAIHGFLYGSKLVEESKDHFLVIARNSPSLVSDTRGYQIESEMELNTVLRRGMNPPNTVEHKRKLAGLLRTNDAEIKGLTYPTVVFLEAATTLESLRSITGSCTRVLTYFVDPALKQGPSATCMSSISTLAIDLYLHEVIRQELPTSRIASQLANIFLLCTHRVAQVSHVALSSADKVIASVPAALCQKASLFALLELLSLMWTGCLDEETDEYNWRSEFVSPKTGIRVELSDSYAQRRKTLNALLARAKVWVRAALEIAPMDVKGLLATYLSEYDDYGTVGHVSLGRSFALEMGGAVPASDHRLMPIKQFCGIQTDTASDFMVQYTTRQAYRHADALAGHDSPWVDGIPLDASMMTLSNGEIDDLESVLAEMQDRARGRKHISLAEVRDVLKRAAALLCRTKKDECTIVMHLVQIPFALFTKPALNLGVSLWMGVINENPRMESRILAEIAHGWEWTVRRRIGLFSPKLRAPDAFEMKMEYAPSNPEEVEREKRHAAGVIVPHLRLLQFLLSRFQANRHGNVNIQRIFQKLVNVTLPAMAHASNHPLAREARFYFILIALQIAHAGRYTLVEKLQVRLKERILSAALSWFANVPCWTFGGNRLQVKAEISILGLVAEQLKKGVTTAGIKRKEELLQILVQSELGRLTTWLLPLDQRKEIPGGRRMMVEDQVANLLTVAWTESPALAIFLLRRFQSPRLESEVRTLLLKFPEKAVHIPQALPLLLTDRIPTDVSWQLKYLLYWHPLDPISATTYFLPSYANNPFILQYAMRSLESHPISTTFFYVPQIVQALRYDALGYVQRFILEAAKFSQLFAHQIIWNMKANAYKDEDATIPDPVKPVLDQTMDRLIDSFTDEDRSFYEREFKFFGEVTAISGTLRPFIRKSKAEKKQKIEEELRKIVVDVGVYVPSNPDGVVIGIDRKSGKPLQSHAKAPFMATFRIQKALQDASASSSEVDLTEKKDEAPKTVDTWLSAIFKVGDDCRQDMLVLQLISSFRTIFASLGLPVYVFPYRVVATAPGCGMIDLIPNSVSRDMLGREAVNGLYDYFITKYGSEDSVAFQEARHNFVKSMAAYSVISYLLQLKDRHNGNIMVNEEGCIIHIDFGFCFDIAPGGITFERAPFKLTTEMVAVMGGSVESQSYRWFEELCVKAFLATREYVDRLCACVVLMIDSGLPCFKPETIQHFRERFVLERTEREAAEYMRGLVNKSFRSYTTKGYDQFQLLTNGIPY
ncbi:hypothetical protein BJ508DRAFT_364570 [Ascobolus immersus RN42]|uniref:1-phosphatidylinositol 4-kinase n=1 Tax=Ascobolus immersus RN42 TaxID=1160509 RepID=A0A3N4HVI7_ASCIM|nr:hypothetical protein BJ508DRAFT_364570 [Ascobolus immersus RN42]